MKKFFSRKFLTAITLVFIDCLTSSGIITNTAGTIFIPIANGIGGLYIIVEGIKDILSNG